MEVIVNDNGEETVVAFHPDALKLVGSNGNGMDN